MREIGHPGAAMLRIGGQPEEAKRAHFSPEMRREAVFPIGLLGDWSNAVAREPPHRVAQGIHVLAQSEIHRAVEHRRPPPPESARADHG
jgi:hypothetical protein